MMKKSKKPMMLKTNIQKTRKKHTNQHLTRTKLVSFQILFNFLFTNNIKKTYEKSNINTRII